MIAILRTYLDIIGLRRGPDAFPASWLLFYLSIGLLVLAWVVQVALIDVPASGVVPALLAYAAALAFYISVAVFFGFRRRVLQMLTAIVGCGSILAVLSAISAVVLAPLLGAPLAGTLATLIWFWSVPVKGHIIAVTVGKHWFFGVGIAMLAFVLRFSIESGFVVQQQSQAL